MLCLHSQLIAQNLLNFLTWWQVCCQLPNKKWKEQNQGGINSNERRNQNICSNRTHFVVWGLLLCGALGVVYEIIGPAKYEQLLSSFGISNGFERTWLWAVMMLILLLSTHFIKAKLLSK